MRRFYEEATLAPLLRRSSAFLLLALALAGAGAARAVPPLPGTDVTIQMSDGVKLATTLYQPPVGTGPAPAILMMHGLGGKRQDLAGLAIGLANRGYVVLTPDFRGHGE